MNIQQVLESRNMPLFYRGMGERTDDFTGQEIHSHERTSRTGKNFKMSLFDNFLLNNVPAIRTMVPRNHCIILTTNPDHASHFGAVHEVEIVKSGPISWSLSDFNDLPGIDDLEYILERVASNTGVNIQSGNITALDNAVQSGFWARQLWRTLSKQNKLLPTEWTINHFNLMAQQGLLGTCVTPQEVPHNADEVWFQGTAKVIRCLDA